ncbi:MAG: hypothetical protein JO236_04880 [Mycobacterium sp.]|uniref:hypothetical protein n=1 Tax=Mycobacterium sp. TaxID=1785 RepID=UPI001EC3BAC8|nr:hypothetical protein [Mycobacterium sp.]MBW0016867.1 hypothetical protein [Mycobacterium sp.]
MDDVTFGRYRLRSLIGEGGIGKVYEPTTPTSTAGNVVVTDTGNNRVVKLAAG